MRRGGRVGDTRVSAVAALSEILSLETRRLAAASPLLPPPPLPPAGKPKAVASPAPPPSPPASVVTPIRFAHTRSAAPGSVELPPGSLCRHMAFVGGSGSGKTTAALAIVEPLLLSGVPVVMLDRKGDLARYADPAAWTAPEPDPDRAARRDRLRAAIDVALFTPGDGRGRPLSVPIVPPDLARASTADRERTAQYAAAGLGQMLG